MILLFRLLVIGLLAIVWLVIGLTISIFRPMHKNNVHVLTQCLTVVQHIIGVKVEIRCNVEELKKDLPGVLVANHQSNWDIVTLADMILPGCVCVGKRSLIWMPVFGILFFLTGNVLLNRESKSKAAASFDVIVDKILKKKCSIWMFPEGHRSKGQGILPFKSGAIRVASSAEVPLIPIVASDYCGQIKLNRWNNGKIIVDCLPVQRLSKEMSKEEIKNVTNKLREDMIAKQKELNELVKK